MTTATVKIGDAEDVELLKSLAELNAAPEPEAPDKVISRPGDESPMIRTQTVSAAFVYLRNNYSGKLKQINKNTLMQTLKLTLNDADCRVAALPLGSKAYILPNVPWLGRVRAPTLLCPLNPAHRDRAKMDALNLGICVKRGKFVTASSVMRHLRLKHKDDWEAIERDRQERREDARDANATLMATSMQGLAKLSRGQKARGKKVKPGQ